jgi:flagellar basal body rod protein FlgG
VLYGLYLSAAGIVTNSHRQDVIANNLANAETTGFKRDLAMFTERRTEAAQSGQLGASNELLEHLGGGIYLQPTRVDTDQGDLEATGNHLDVAIQGKGFFTVSDGKTTRLTRAGSFMKDQNNDLVMTTDHAQKVLDEGGRPIQLDPAKEVAINPDGTIAQGKDIVAKLGIVDVPADAPLTKAGSSTLDVPDPKSLKPSTATLRSEFVERSNVDPSTELTSLMDAQRQLEANANMIRYQDQMLAKLVNEVGKIG